MAGLVECLNTEARMHRVCYGHGSCQVTRCSIAGCNADVPQTGTKLTIHRKPPTLVFYYFFIVQCFVLNLQCIFRVNSP